MNSFQIEALTDYKADSSDMNLNLFIMSINPTFKINKIALKIVQTLIGKYDGSPTRDAAIINYIQPKSISLLNVSQIETLKNKINDTNSILNVNNYLKVSTNSNIERRQDIFKNLFGDFKFVGSFANSLISNEKPLITYSFSDNEMADSRNFTNKTLMQPEIIIEWAEELTGFKVINFYDIYSNKIMLQGNLSNYYFKKNNSKTHKLIEYKGNTDQYKTMGTINASTPMNVAFKDFEQVRSKME